MITQLAARIPSLRSMLTCVNHAYVLRLSLRLNIEKWTYFGSIKCTPSLTVTT